LGAGNLGRLGWQETENTQKAPRVLNRSRHRPVRQTLCMELLRVAPGVKCRQGDIFAGFVINMAPQERWARSEKQLTNSRLHGGADPGSIPDPAPPGSAGIATACLIFCARPPRTRDVEATRLAARPLRGCRDTVSRFAKAARRSQLQATR
jgi:hypothetical protein